MARDWLPRKARPSEASDEGSATRTETAPISHDAESERDDGPAQAGRERGEGAADAPPVPDQRRDRPGTADRLVAAARRAAAGLGAAAIARPPAVRGWLLPRLARLVLAVAGGLLLCASFPPLSC